MQIAEDLKASILDQARTLYNTHHSVDPGPDCLGEIVECQPSDLYDASVKVAGTITSQENGGSGGINIHSDSQHVDLEGLIDRLFLAAVSTAFVQLYLDAEVANPIPDGSQTRRHRADADSRRDIASSASKIVKVIELETNVARACVTVPIGR